MIASSIRHLAAPQKGQRFAAAEFESRVHIFDFASSRPVASFDTVLDFGGTRLAFDDEKSICVAASYYFPGVACYSVPSGEVLWRRRDIRKVQSLRILKDDELACEIDQKPLHILRLSDGSTIQAMQACRGYIKSRFTEHHFVEKHRSEVRDASGSMLVKIPRETFAFLSVAFTPTLIIVSESGGAVRGFDLRTGKLRWRASPPSGSHVIELGFHEEIGRVLGVLWPYEAGGKKSILQLNPDDGALCGQFDVGEPAEVCFCRSGSKALTSDGLLFNVAAGVIEMRYDFPQKDYAD